MDKSGRIRTVAGMVTRRSVGANGPALKCHPNGPKHQSLDRNGSVVIYKTENHPIHCYQPIDVTIYFIVGSGAKETASLGVDPKQAELKQSHSIIAYRQTGELYISDSSRNRMGKITRQVVAQPITGAYLATIAFAVRRPSTAAETIPPA